MAAAATAMKMVRKRPFVDAFQISRFNFLRDCMRFANDDGKGNEGREFEKRHSAGRNWLEFRGRSNRARRWWYDDSHHYLKENKLAI